MLVEIRIVPHTNKYTVTRVRHTDHVIYDDPDIAVSMMRVKKFVHVSDDVVPAVEADLNERQIWRLRV